MTDKPLHTKDKLAAELQKVNLLDMATKAAQGYYHDFLSPLDLPEMQLVNDLAQAYITSPHEHRAAIAALRRRVIDGDFDASTQESEEWFRSPEGQAAFQSLIRNSMK